MPGADPVNRARRVALAAAGLAVAAALGGTTGCRPQAQCIIDDQCPGERVCRDQRCVLPEPDDAGAGADRGGAPSAPDVGADAEPVVDAACVAASERCNGVDDDCDGRIDEVIEPIRSPYAVADFDQSDRTVPRAHWSEDGQGLVWLDVVDGERVLRWARVDDDGAPADPVAFAPEIANLRLRGLASSGANRYALAYMGNRSIAATLNADGGWSDDIVDFGGPARGGSIASVDGLAFAVVPYPVSGSVFVLEPGRDVDRAELSYASPLGSYRALGSGAGAALLTESAGVVALRELDVRSGVVGPEQARLTGGSAVPDVASAAWTGSVYVGAWVEAHPSPELQIARFAPPDFRADVARVVPLADDMVIGRLSILPAGDDVYVAWPVAVPFDSDTEAGVYLLRVAADGATTGPARVTTDPEADYGWVQLRPTRPGQPSGTIDLAWTRGVDERWLTQIGRADLRCPD